MSHAVAAARAGLDVLPLTPGGKTPPGALAPHGKDDASHDVELVRDWWVQRPTANIGIRPAHGVLVVDVDPRNGGTTALVELTGSARWSESNVDGLDGWGGLHAWDRVAVPLRARLCDGVDLKHHSGYVVMPPSLHPSGKRYVWANDLPIADVPAWLRCMSIADEKFASVATFRKSGAAVATPTWIVPLDDGRVGFWTSSSAGKTKRLRTNPVVTVQAEVVPGLVEVEVAVPRSAPAVR